jgi:two-component system chemotaxis response regulator CheB
MKPAPDVKATVRPAAAPARLVVVATSSGGLRALSEVLGSLPADLPAPIVVVQHLAAARPSLLSEILSQRTALVVTETKQMQKLVAGHVYTAPPDRHVVVRSPGRLYLTGSAEENYSRPSADPLFRTAADCYGAHLLAVVLTGRGRDGSLGAGVVREHGGLVVAQSEATSQEYGMPGAAVNAGAVDRVVPLDQIGAAITRFALTGALD